jgi:mannose-1-phosphate guanylyltransferase/mannose-6-phosphate isomerase
VSERKPDGWVETPWGGYAVVHKGSGYQIKLLTVETDQAISLQLHHRRSEFWVVVNGIGRAELNENVIELRAGNNLTVPQDARHRLTNVGPSPFEIVEVQIGEYLGEDDIVRFDDRYGRT